MKIIAMLVIISLAFSLKKEDLFKASPHIQNNETIKKKKGVFHLSNLKILPQN